MAAPYWERYGCDTKEGTMYQMCYERDCRKYGQYVSADHAERWHGIVLRVPNEDDFDEHGELKAYR